MTFPVISADLGPSTKARLVDAVGVEAKIVQHLDCARDIPDRTHLAVVAQPVASTSDALGGGADGRSGHRTVFADTNAGTPNDGGTARASSTDC